MNNARAHTHTHTHISYLSPHSHTSLSTLLVPFVFAEIPPNCTHVCTHRCSSSRFFERIFDQETEQNMSKDEFKHKMLLHMNSKTHQQFQDATSFASMPELVPAQYINAKFRDQSGNETLFPAEFLGSEHFSTAGPIPPFGSPKEEKNKFDRSPRCPAGCCRRCEARPFDNRCDTSNESLISSSGPHNLTMQHSCRCRWRGRPQFVVPCSPEPREETPLPHTTTETSA